MYRIVRTFTYNPLVAEYAKTLPTPTTLQHFINFGKLKSLDAELLSSRFLHKEIPVRIAHLHQDLEMLPAPLRLTPSVQKVKQWHMTSFNQLTAIRENMPDDEFKALFGKSLIEVYHRHTPVVVTMAKGVHEMRRAASTPGVDPATQYFLDRFYMTRIGIRMLIGQHVELFGSAESRKDVDSNRVGMIHSACDIKSIVEDAAEHASYLCRRTYDTAPKVVLKLPQKKYDNGRLVLPCVPSHVYHCLFELLKNSMRAVVERHGVDDDDDLPPVKVTLVRGDEEDVSIKIADQGGGIPRSALPLLFTYMYTTAKEPILPDADGGPSEVAAPLAGFGYGLPLSRLYARYFGGDLQLVSMEGYGTDALVYLKRAADVASEYIPKLLDGPDGVAHPPRV